MKFLKYFLAISIISFVQFSCENDTINPIPTDKNTSKELTIFHINDQHGRLENFSKIKYIIDKEGVVRHIHIGEGRYDQQEEIIKALLAEQT